KDKIGVYATGGTLGTFSAAMAPTFTVIYADDSNSAGGGKQSPSSVLKGDLRYVLTQSNAYGSGDNIAFDPTVFPTAGSTTITLTDVLPTISAPVTINGPG